MTLCYEYKNVISLEEIDVQYVVIRCWWYSSMTTNEARLQLLENWLNFSIFMLENGEDL